MSNKQILVIGAGISGICTGILLQEAGFDVNIWTKDLTQNTTSNRAAAFWYPYLCNPKEKAIIWSIATYKYLEDNVISEPNSGTRYITFTEFFKEKESDPWWRPAVEIFERPIASELPSGYIDGFRTKAIIMDTSLYLPWLLKQLDERSISIEQKTICNFDEALDNYNVVVNCTGLGSRELCNDKRVYPVRGQVVQVKNNGFNTVIADESNGNLTYIIPRFNDIIVGGTAQENDWNLTIDPQDTIDILAKVKNLASEFEHVEILEEKVGLRPARDEVRIEIEKVNDKAIIHNYGHGGAGFTLSWGCAQEVVDLVKEFRVKKD